MVRSHPIAVRLEPELEDAVRKQAAFWHVSISQAIRNMVFDYFDKSEEPKIVPHGTDMETTLSSFLDTERGRDLLREKLRELIK